MRAQVGKTLITMSAALIGFDDHAYPQSSIGETLSGPDSHETGQVRAGIFWETGVVFGRACWNEESSSTFNISAIISRTFTATEMTGLSVGIGSEGRSISILAR